MDQKLSDRLTSAVANWSFQKARREEQTERDNQAEQQKRDDLREAPSRFEALRRDVIHPTLQQISERLPPSVQPGNPFPPFVCLECAESQIRIEGHHQYLVIAFSLNEDGAVVVDVHTGTGSRPKKDTSTRPLAEVDAEMVLETIIGAVEMHLLPAFSCTEQVSSK